MQLFSFKFQRYTANFTTLLSKDDSCFNGNIPETYIAVFHHCFFPTGASGSHVYTEMYPGESEDFAGADLAKLDIWVFDKVKVRIMMPMLRVYFNFKNL